MSTEIMRPTLAEDIERVVIGGDLSGLKPEQRLSYYKAVCDSIGLNPLTKPLEYILLNGKLQLYARKDATDQLRNIHNVSITIVARETVEGCYVVTARATMPNGRSDESIGAVAIANLKGDALCNALMKAETKARRRVTLSLCGLGLLDESELDTIPMANRASATAEPISAPIPLPTRVVAALPEMPQPIESPKPETQTEAPTPVSFITTAQAQRLHMRFRESLPESQKINAEELLHEFLKRNGFVDADGFASAKLIEADRFQAIGKDAVKFAKGVPA